MTGIIHRKVRFEHPVMEELHAGGFSAVDMHFHTSHSDGIVSVRNSLKKALGLGFGLSITDHNHISGVREAVGLNSGPLLIPGIEVSASDGPHILVYFYSAADLFDFHARHIREHIRKSPYLAITLNTSQIIERTEGYSCIRSAAHPYGYLVFNKGLQKCIDCGALEAELLPRFDALEVVCGSMPRSQNERAIELAGRHNTGITGGTDGHLLGDLGTVLTCARAGSCGEFLDAILKMQNFIIGQEKSLFGKGIMGSLVLTKYLKYTIPSLAIHYEQNVPRIKKFMEKSLRKIK
jgi:hypothetical protein